jgi:hypothetical protein
MYSIVCTSEPFSQFADGQLSYQHSRGKLPNHSLIVENCVPNIEFARKDDCFSKHCATCRLSSRPRKLFVDCNRHHVACPHFRDSDQIAARSACFVSRKKRGRHISRVIQTWRTGEFTSGDHCDEHCRLKLEGVHHRDVSTHDEYDEQECRVNFLMMLWMYWSARTTEVEMAISNWSQEVVYAKLS